MTFFKRTSFFTSYINSSNISRDNTNNGRDGINEINKQSGVIIPSTPLINENNINNNENLIKENDEDYNFYDFSIRQVWNVWND